MDQDPEIRLGFKLEEWLPKILKYAKLNTAKKKTHLSGDLLSLTTLDVPCSTLYCYIRKTYLSLWADISQIRWHQ